MSRRRTKKAQAPSHGVIRRRLVLLGAALGCAVFVLVARAVQLQLVRSDFLQTQGDMRYLRQVEIPAYRGTIFDRNGKPLAVSTPVQSVWANPGKLLQFPQRLAELAATLELDAQELSRYLAKRQEREFLWLRRQVRPELAGKVMDLEIPGVGLRQEYKRYYPLGAVTAHVVGFTNIDDHGQEGLELAFDQWLSGRPGQKLVIKDRFGRSVEDVERVREVEPGRDLTLSLDSRLQYIAWRGLKDTVTEQQADSGTVVVLSVETGEILTMVNYPAYNPNGPHFVDASYRNRAVTDFYEAGSAMKPFTMAAALLSGKYTPYTPIDTRPGWFMVAGHTVQDIHNYGLLDATGVIVHSSNVGMSKIALSLKPKYMWSVLDSFGFGEVTGSGFPGESPGILPHYRYWGPIEQATMSFGYGLSVTPLQLARAYAAIGSGGLLRAPSFVHGSHNPPRRVLDRTTAGQLQRMLELVVRKEAGTGNLARVAHYRVGGKTGTSHIAGEHGYTDNYVSVFAGLAPMSDPKICVVIVVDNPTAGEYYGGQVAAPLFADVMRNALRLFDIEPDRIAEDLLRSVRVGPGDAEGRA